MPKKTKELRDAGPVLRSNRLYISLREIGEVNEKGKSVFAIGYKGKTIAQPDRPLSTAVFSLIAHVANMAKYTTVEDRDADLKELKRLVKSIHYKPISGESDEPVPAE